MSVVAAAVAVAAAAAESALTKLAIRLSLSRGWVGVSMDLGGMLPVRVHTQVVCDRIQVGHIGLGGADFKPAGLMVGAHAPEVYPGCLCVPASQAEGAVVVAFCWCWCLSEIAKTTLVGR